MKPEEQNTDQQVENGQNQPNGETQNIETVQESEAVKNFKKFLGEFKSGKLYIYNDDVTVTEQDLKNTYDEFCAKSRKDNGDKDEKFNDVIDSLNNRGDTTVEKMKKIINLAIWLWALPESNIKKANLLPDDKINEDLLEIEGVAGAGRAYKAEKTSGIRFIIYLLLQLRIKIEEKQEEEELGNKLKKIIEGFHKYENDKYLYDSNYTMPEGVRNLLLHLCSPKEYPPIASTENKKDIVKAFWACLDDEIDLEKALENLNKTLISIRNILISDSGTSFKEFYEDPIRSFWDTTKSSIKVDKDGNLPPDALLKFKKAIVLYGPPGTSKTFSARKLAKDIIRFDFAEKNKGEGAKYGDFVKNASAIFGEKEGNAGKSQMGIMSHIHRLQLHPNYTYDDFIAGKTITVNNEGKTEIKSQEGYLLKLIGKINEDKEKGKEDYRNLPHIVILDEINRVDISRVFGELFTAMEPGYRKVGVDLPLTDNGGKPLKLQVPENLYFIGTMNLIDFSLEQVDFALRRRFAWVERNYNEGKLKIILDNKINDNEIVDIDEDTVSNYIKKCSALNDKISNQSNLGPAYQIGHTFFAEVIDIFKELRDQNKVLDSAVELLWNISIKPMIEAYCGTMDSEAQENFIEECRKAFCPKPEEETEQSQTIENTNGQK